MDKNTLAQMIAEALPKDIHGEVVAEYGAGNFPVYTDPQTLANKIADHVFKQVSSDK